MESKIVLYKGVFWPKNEQNFEITPDYAPHSTTAYQLMEVHNNFPNDTVKYCNKFDVMVQAGGNVGFYVNQFSKIFKTVYTFEPMPLLFYCLNLNVTSENVYKFNCCLGNTNECVSMNDATLTLGHGGSHVNLNSELHNRKTPTIKIDNLNLQICDLIQLDLEGYEFNALLGGIETIKRCKPVIIVEKFDAWAARYNSSLSKVEELLNTLGYIYVDTIANGDNVFKYNNKF